MPRHLETRLDGPLLIEPDSFGDERGFFLETWSRDEWAELGIEADFVQHNHSRSVEGALRGIHFQLRPGQAKLVRCARGRIFDVVVDLRSESPTFGEWEGHMLDDRDHHQLFIPVGFGHGFCVVSPEADVSYLVSSFYDPETEAGIRWDDPEVAIEWPVPDPVLSERDQTAPTLAEIGEKLPW